MKINKAKLRQIISEEVASIVDEKKDKVSKKISYLMGKEDKPQDQAVAIALDMKDRGELEEGFKSGEKVTHDDYGDGIVTHPGTKNTNVAVKFDKDTGRGKNIKVNRNALKAAVKEEMDAMRGASRPGAGIEDIAEPDDEETRDRAFGSPEERLITLINARDALSQMTPADLEALSLSLDAPMVATLRHILANPMYKPGLQEGQDEAQDLIRKAEFEKSKGRLHQGDVDRIKDRLAKGERPHSIKRDYRRNF